MKMKKLLLIALPLLLLMLSTVSCDGDPEEAAVRWIKMFGGEGEDVGYSVRQTSDGGYIVVGKTACAGGFCYHDIYLLKVDEYGEKEWSKTPGGAYGDIGSSVLQTSDGGYIIAGQTHSYGSGNMDIYLVKTDFSGNETWSKTFGGANNEGLLWFSYSPNQIQQTNDGGYIIIGQSESYGTDAMFDTVAYLIKTNDIGNEQWSKIYRGIKYANGYSIQKTTDGGYIIIGDTSSDSLKKDVYLLKIDTFGNEHWSKTFGGNNVDTGYSVQQTTDGGYIIVGSTIPDGGSFSYIYVIKTDTLGNEEWSKTFGGSTWNAGYSIQQTDDGGFIITGKTSTFDLCLIKTDSNGNEEWSRYFSDNYKSCGYSIQQTDDGGYIIAGETLEFGRDWPDLYLIKTDENGYVSELD
jgi:hypothetical protein